MGREHQEAHSEGLLFIVGGSCLWWGPPRVHGGELLLLWWGAPIHGEGLLLFMVRGSSYSW